MVRPLARSSAGVRSEWTMPRPAVIQLTSPGTIFCSEPRLSRCMIAPSNRYVTVARPICGCGRTSRPTPGSSVAGPMWSKKMNGPIRRAAMAGSTRRTVRLPTSRRCGLRTALIEEDMGRLGWNGEGRLRSMDDSTAQLSHDESQVAGRARLAKRAASTAPARRASANCRIE